MRDIIVKPKNPTPQKGGKRKRSLETEQTIPLNHSMLAIPEVLFNPSDIGNAFETSVLIF